MINIIVLISLCGVIVISYVITRMLERSTLAFKSSIWFLLYSIFLVMLLSWFNNITEVQSSSDLALFNKLLDFNFSIVKVRNTVILISLTYLAVGTYSEFRKNRKRLVLVISFFLFLLSLIFLIGTFIAGAFIL
jgi:hypothetical protein